ncbi:hypothetical protein [Ekhidna sp.]|uniref:hypothetical protein n=1 Tax=Ekhidna sp. TaxID=2608089 RepID=UPI003BA9ECB1
MRLVGKNILLISPESWDHISVSKHHYATHLAKRGNRVVFLNPPGNSWNIINTNNDNIRVVNYPGFWKGQRFLPFWLRKKNQSNIYEKIEAIAGLHFDVVWSFDNSVFYQMDVFPSRVLTISHIVDLNMDYEMEIAAKTAQVCFCTTTFIQQRLETYNSRVFLINHGYNVSMQSVDFIPQRKSEGTVAVGYAGNLDIQYLDWELIKSVSSEYQEVDFYFAGSLKSEGIQSYFNGMPNMHYVGVLKSDQVQSFYSEMDILIIAYKADIFKEQLANPHKVLEYLYSGKPIVSTFTQEYQNKELLFMSNRNVEWPSKFQYVLRNLDKCSSKEMVDQRKNYALDHTYDKQIDRIEKILASLPS